MNKAKPQLLRIWGVYLFLFALGILSSIDSMTLFNNEAEAGSINTISIYAFWGLEWGLAGYSGWKTKQLESSLATCFTAGALCSISNTLGKQIGIYTNMSLTNIETTLPSGLYYLPLIIGLLLFWWPGLLAMLGGVFYDKTVKKSSSKK